MFIGILAAGILVACNLLFIATVIHGLPLPMDFKVGTGTSGKTERFLGGYLEGIIQGLDGPSEVERAYIIAGLCYACLVWWESSRNWRAEPNG